MNAHATRFVSIVGIVTAGVFAAGCSGAQGGAGEGAAAEAASPSSSEVATSVVSGALNNTNGSSVAMIIDRAPPRLSPMDRVLDALNPIGTAHAATWTCTGGSLSPKFDGPGSYAYTPRQCEVMWDSGKTASSTWSNPFTLAYGSSCDDKHPYMDLQAGGCVATRTTDGSTRTITGPDGNSYAITHDTNGEGTGWDSAVSPAPSDGGVVLTCAEGGCTAGKSLVINGSHVTGTVDIRDRSFEIWDHTVSTGSSGVTVTGSGVGRVVNGSVTVQHNLAKYTAEATFNAVTYTEAGCCFPTGGSVSTTFTNGADKSKTESLAFSDVCGDATLTTASGETQNIVLQHCL